MLDEKVEVIESITIPTKIKYRDIIWIPEQKKNNNRKNTKQNYFIKWIYNNKEPGDLFTLDEFFKDHPKHRKDKHCRERMDKTISIMIRDDKIRQGNNKDEFKVLK